MKHPVSLILAVLLLLAAGATALLTPAKFIGLGLAALGALVFLFPRAPLWGKWTLGALVLIALPGFILLEIPILRAARTDEQPQADYLIVLGAKVNGTEPSFAMADRLAAALDYLNTYPDAVAVVSGGQGADEGISEAQAMQTWLMAHGVAPERILLEDQSETTRENLSYSFQVIQSWGGDVKDGVAIVTSEYHLYRAKLMAEALGARPIGVAARTSMFGMRVNYFIREAFAAAYMRVAGVLY